eukprot:TRINITY_DN80507_c0_g1_i1.p2 TRINITY_DN80507_c0_g1~~TRINITY_DN80507_c0_g1_i1.p2  ORF type:complete len:144 (-),score=19.40 TRINITY_DN80507_c0_g1_i1:317-748(-)
MALQWVAIACITAFEAVLLLVVTLPLPRRITTLVVPAVTAILQPLLAAVPFCLFTLLDVAWKYERSLECKGQACTSADRDRFQKSLMKSQRNMLLGVTGIFLYWVLYRACTMMTKIHGLEKLANADKTRAVKEDKEKKSIKEQ